MTAIRLAVAVALAAIASGCATAYSTGQRADGSRWRLVYFSAFWAKDFTAIDAANGTAGRLESKPDGEEIAAAIAEAAVKAAVTP